MRILFIEIFILIFIEKINLYNKLKFLDNFLSQEIIFSFCKQ